MPNDIAGRWHDATFAELIDKLSAEDRELEARTDANRICWLGRVSMACRLVYEAEADFRHHCISTGVARHGRTVTMLLRLLCPTIRCKSKTALRWGDCLLYVIESGATDTESASALIVSTGGIVAAHNAWRSAHSDVCVDEDDQPDEEEDDDDEDTVDHSTQQVVSPNRYWLTPRDVYATLDAEFHFDFDPCPYPRPFGFDGLTRPWGNSNYCNPPFLAADAMYQRGMTAFVRKAIEEHKQGKTVVFILPTKHFVNLLLEAGAEARSAGRIPWSDASTGEPCPSPPPVTCFILRGRKTNG
jgi:hypothetical protein